MAPLVFAIAGEALARGLTAAARAYERSIGAVRVQRINTYRYQAIIPAAMAPHERTAQARRSRDKMDAAMARLGELWRTAWLPEVQAHLAHWETFGLQGASLPALLSHLDETIARATRLWEIHFLLLTPLYRALSRFGTLYRDLFGADSALEAYRLLQGFGNKTLETGQALWQLSRRARVMPAVRAVLEEQDASDVVAELAQVPDGLSFLAGLRAYLQEYGQRGDKWSLDAPSWIEDPAPVIKNLRDYLTQTCCEALADRAALATERDRLVADTRARLQGNPRPVIEQFEVLRKVAQNATVLSEDHSFWIDFRGMYQVRRVFMECGRRFAEAGVLYTAADILYLTPDELRETAVARPWPDRRALVAARQAEMEHFRAIAPPPVLGTPPPHAPTHDALGRAWGAFTGGATRLSGDPSVLHGTPGSPGLARGPAKVVRSLSDAGNLGRGDILVAETTAPPWTPLFATVAAVITATGGILSHSAIVAREYRIPAVVGLGEAVAMVHDGQLLEVDGDAGVVRVVGPA
jgi:pyruvate,water dikinase